VTAPLTAGRAACGHAVSGLETVARRRLVSFVSYTGMVNYGTEPTGGAPREAFFVELAEIAASGREPSEEEMTEFYRRHDQFMV
jgi:hypothetical protein